MSKANLIEKLASEVKTADNSIRPTVSKIRIGPAARSQYLPSQYLPEVTP